MKTKYYTILISILFLSACNKTDEEKIIQYRADGASSEYEISWLDETGKKESATIKPNSSDEIWSRSFEAEEGQVYFLSGRYYNTSNKLNISVLLNGKTLKQSSSVYDTTRYLIVSGTIPYDD